MLAAALATSAGAEEIGSMSATVDTSKRTATISNGILTLTINNAGRVSKMTHPDNGTANILGSNGIYFDYTADKNRALSPSKVELVKLTDDYVEVLYTNTSGNPSYQQGYILRKDVSAVYTYVIANGTASSSSVNVKETRVCTRLASTFLDGYVDEVMQGIIPSNAEMSAVESDAAAKVQDATYRMPDGSVYTKYDWAQFIDRDLFHGLMNGKVGVWNIPVSYEWLNGGPMRQELTVHATGKSPITIQMLQGEHLGGAAQAFDDGERHLYGPFMIYVNAAGSRDEMIADAREMALKQRQEWPYTWFENELYDVERGTVSGKFNVTTGQGNHLKVVLGGKGELIRQGKGYMFWAETDADGNFTIENVRPGDYSLYAYALEGNNTEEFMMEQDVTVKAGAETALGNISWTPVCLENLHFVIGENNRLSDGYNMSDTPRAYGLWEQVPANVDFRYGTSVPAEDWYYGQVKNGTWSVYFNLDKPMTTDALLTASVAGSTNKPSVNVKVNDASVATWSFPNNDAAIYRSATQAGRHCVKTAKIPASAFVAGENKVSFTMSGISKNGGVMWDCVKLESGEQAESAGIADVAVDSGNAPLELFTITGVKVATFAPGEAFGGAVAPGIYIYRSGSKTGKIIVR